LFVAAAFGAALADGPARGVPDKPEAWLGAPHERHDVCHSRSNPCCGRTFASRCIVVRTRALWAI
jgi:hypothetical protein